MASTTLTDEEIQSTWLTPSNSDVAPTADDDGTDTTAADDDGTDSGADDDGTDSGDSDTTDS